MNIWHCRINHWRVTEYAITCRTPEASCSLRLETCRIGLYIYVLHANQLAVVSVCSYRSLINFSRNGDIIPIALYSAFHNAHILVFVFSFISMVQILMLMLKRQLVHAVQAYVHVYSCMTGQRSEIPNSGPKLGLPSIRGR